MKESVPDGDIPRHPQGWREDTDPSPTDLFLFLSLNAPLAYELSGLSYPGC